MYEKQYDDYQLTEELRSYAGEKHDKELELIALQKELVVLQLEIAKKQLEKLEGRQLCL